MASAREVNHAAGPQGKPAASFLLTPEQIHKGQSPDIPGSLKPGPGPAGDPAQGEAAGASEAVQCQTATPAN